MDSSFIHLHCHSNFSLHEGTATVEELVERTAKFGMHSLALTDHNTLNASVNFYEKCRMRGIKPVIGSEITMKDGSVLVLLVKNREGYNSLCRLLTGINLRDGHGEFKCTLQDILANKTGLIVLSGGRRGRITQLVRKKRISDAAELCRVLRNAFQKDFYIEINSLFDDDILLNYRLADLSKIVRVPLAATNDVYLLTPADQPLRTVLLAMKKLTTINRLEDTGTDRQYLCPAEEMKKNFGRYPEALKNTAIIAEKCNYDYSLGKPVFPSLDLPENETGYSILWKTAFEGIKTRYRPLNRQAMERLEYELNIIHRKGFTEYFLIAKDIVDFCRRKNIPCVGRGSAGDSLVSYVLGITQVDPIRHDLYFERFLNPERSEPPDIDLDICWKSRDDVLDYVYSTYGQNKTAVICTFNTFQLRSAIADIGKVFGLPEDEVRKLTKTLPHRSVSYLEKALRNIPECRDHPVTEKAYRNIVDISKKIAGFPRYLSVHSGGVIIAPDEITRYTALEVSAKGLVISQHDMYAIEKLGLVKMDVLGVRGLSVIADCLKAVGIENMEAIPDNDENVMRMIMSGQTVGCFQLESPAMRGLLKKMQVQTLEDIIAAIAVIRPGPAEGGMKDAFIRRRAGIEKVTYPHPLLEPVLKETYGVVVYQEQVLRIASIIAGLSFGEADLLRRAMTKSRNQETIKPVQEKFILGAASKGIPEKSAQSIWQFLQNFVGYGFNKAHSATYGLLAYKSSYLKRYFPVEFMAAVLNNGGGFYSMCEYIEEARRMGITICPPDVNRAEKLFTYKNNSIIAGLSPVFGLTTKSIKRIITERENESFRDIFDFLQRAGLMEKEALSLAKAGALRSLHKSEPESLAIIKIFYKNRRKSHVTKRLILDLNLKPYTLTQRIISELEILGFAVSAHPLNMFPEIDIDPSIISSAELEKCKDKTVSVTGWMVTSRRAPTRDGKYIKFATIEDKYGLMEAVLFPEIYDKFGKVLRGYGPFKITGKIQKRVKGELNIIVETVKKVRSKQLSDAENRQLEREIDEDMLIDAA